MPTEFNRNTFDDQSITCPKCGWQGKGSDTVIIDFFGVVDAEEVHCPHCDEKLGILRDTDEDKKDDNGDPLSNQVG